MYLFFSYYNLYNYTITLAIIEQNNIQLHYKDESFKHKEKLKLRSNKIIKDKCGKIKLLYF